MRQNAGSGSLIGSEAVYQQAQSAREKRYLRETFGVWTSILKKRRNLAKDPLLAGVVKKL